MSRKRTDAIRDYLEGELHYAELNHAEREYFKALELIEAMWADGKTDKAIRTVLLERYQMTSGTARKAERDAELVFGNLREVDRKIQRYRAEQMALKAFEMANDAKDYKAMITAVKAYNEATGINNDDPDLPPLEDLEASTNVLMLPPGIEADMLNRLAEGTVDLTQAPEPVTIDIPHDELDA